MGWTKGSRMSANCDCPILKIVFFCGSLVPNFKPYAALGRVPLRLLEITKLFFILDHYCFCLVPVLHSQSLSCVILSYNCFITTTTTTQLELLGQSVIIIKTRVTWLLGVEQNWRRFYIWHKGVQIALLYRSQYHTNITEALLFPVDSLQALIAVRESILVKSLLNWTVTFIILSSQITFLV